MPYLMRGSTGNNVLGVQTTLRQAGLYDGRLDGLWGPKTEAAVRDWQSANGLKVDGLWGPKTSRRTLELMQYGVTPPTVGTTNVEVQ